MAVRPIDANALHAEISKWPEPVMYKDWVQSAIATAPTLTPPNEWVSRLRELDELYTKLHAVTGFTAEQLLEMFAAGYTLEKHDYSKSFEEMASLLEYEKEHANAYYEECGQWEAENEKLRGESIMHHNAADNYFAELTEYRQERNEALAELEKRIK